MTNATGGTLAADSIPPNPKLTLMFAVPGCVMLVLCGVFLNAGHIPRSELFLLVLLFGGLIGLIFFLMGICCGIGGLIGCMRGVGQHPWKQWLWALGANVCGLLMSFAGFVYVLAQE